MQDEGRGDPASMRFTFDPAHDGCKAVSARVKREMDEEDAESDRVKRELLRDPTDGLETLAIIRRELPAHSAYARCLHLGNLLVRAPGLWPKLYSDGLLETYVDAIIDAPVGVRAEKVRSLRAELPD